MVKTRKRNKAENDNEPSNRSTVDTNLEHMSRWQKRYANDPTYRQKKIATARLKYQEKRDEIIEKKKAKYEEKRPEILEKKKAKYEEKRPEILQKRKSRYKKQRHDILTHRKANYELERQQILEKKKTRYQSSRSRRQIKRRTSKMHYHRNEQVRDQKKKMAKSHKVKKKKSLGKIDKMIQEFQKQCQEAPIYVCCSCFRLQFRDQVKLCHPDTYCDTLRDTAISRKYLHICDENECSDTCILGDGPRGSLYICINCDTYMKKGQMPPLCHANGLELEDVPDELISLNKLEKQLVSLRLPFMKIVRLPRAAEQGVIGKCVCVVSNINHTRKILPAPIHDSLIVPVKLKRKLEYEGHVTYQMVDIMKCEKALRVLKSINPLYGDIDIDLDNVIGEQTESNLQSLVNDTSTNDKYMQYDGSTDSYDEMDYETNMTEDINSSQNITKSADHDTNVMGTLQCYKDYEEFRKAFVETIPENDLKAAGPSRLSIAWNDDDGSYTRNIGSLNDYADYSAFKEVFVKSIPDDDLEMAGPSHSIPLSVAHELAYNVCDQSISCNIPVYDRTDDCNVLPNSNIVQDAYDATTSEYTLSDNESEHEDDITHSGLQLDTCMQPVDLQSEVLAQHDDKIYSVAPGEGGKLVSLFEEKELEGLAFPTLFPTGKNTLSDERQTKLSRSKYYKARLLNADGRFASDASYIFFAQYTSELEQLSSSISVRMRQGTQKTKDGKRITAGMLNDAEQLRKLLGTEQSFRFMQPIRGSPQYWSNTMNDLFACIRQNGIPTWFCSFSAAELSRWPEVVEAILKHKGKDTKFEDLSYQERCDIVAENPVIAVTMFIHRVRKFFTTCIKGEAKPVGKVVRYFYRIEFQQRGAPHIHVLIWVEDAPILDESSDEEVIAFYKLFVATHIPDEPSLQEKVIAVQSHSPKHTKTCRKGNKVCRFGYPKMPADDVFIVRPYNQSAIDDDDLVFEDVNVMTHKRAKQCLSKLAEYLESGNCHADDNYLEIAGFQDMAEYKKALAMTTEKTMIVSKRSPADVWVNNYNPALLEAWNANMDIQFVENAYSCVMYMTSYVCKAEHELGEIMKEAQQEIAAGNDDLRTQMKKLGSVYFKHREVSVQEAVVRVCGLPLKDSSYDVVNVPTDENPVRMSKPLSQIQNVAKSNRDDDSIWMPNLYDRYTARPDTNEFQIMCLAKFAASYRLIGNQQKTSERATIYELPRNLGKIQQRSQGDAVIKFMKWSKSKHPEKHYHAQLKLYLPHRNSEHLKPNGFDSYEEFYMNGAVKLGDTAIRRVKDVVNENKEHFEPLGESLDEAINALRENGPLQDAWALVAPQTEQERLESLEERDNLDVDDEAEDEEIVDLQTNNEAGQPRVSDLPNVELSERSVKPLMKSMNTKQQEVFYTVRRWCIDKSSGKNPEPFHLFITGGAGVGKSHLIKCIHHEASRLLKGTADPGKVKVLLTAPTGVAAFNINGSTLHHAFMLPLTMRELKSLTDKSLQTLRTNLEDVDIVIIDEISMVDGMTMLYIHDRLQQIKNKRGNDDWYGGVSIIAVGDFYQLPPVKGKSLITPGNIEANMVFTSLFKMVELTEVMRQKDDAAFANMLNRIRKRKKGEPLLKSDREMLQSRNDRADKNEDALHVYALNAPVDEMNDQKLDMLSDNTGKSIHESQAQDFRKNANGDMQKLLQPVKAPKSSLLPLLRLCVGAPVMLLRNLDVDDGLANGVIGKTKGFKLNDGGGNEIGKVYVEFNENTIGQKRKIGSGQQKGCIEIDRHEENLLGHMSNITRRQIPLRLCWASTIHKTQGMSLKAIVVSCRNIRNHGQAYVAFSRAQTLDGLFITDFNIDAIHCDPNIEPALELMQKHENDEGVFLAESNGVKLMHQNVEGLLNNFSDVQKFLSEHPVQAFIMTETWLSPEICDAAIAHEDYEIYRSDAVHSEGRRRGVAFYVSKEVSVETLHLPETSIDFAALCLSTKEKKIACVGIYRHPKMNEIKACEQIEKLIQSVLLCQNCDAFVFAGDFNENLKTAVRHPIYELFQTYGFEQCLSSETTWKGTCIDHIYIRQNRGMKVRSGVIQTYYSYHDAIYALFE